MHLSIQGRFKLVAWSPFDTIHTLPVNSEAGSYLKVKLGALCAYALSSSFGLSEALLCLILNI